MTLKNEIDEIINKKRTELQKKDAESKIALDRRIAKFVPMITLLKEIVASIEPQYIQAGYYSFTANISIGRLRDGRFVCKTRREISSLCFLSTLGISIVILKAAYSAIRIGHRILNTK
jgi:hypothetical protein